MNVTLTGYKEIDETLKALPLAITHKVLSDANYAAARPLVTREQLLAPEGPTGNLVDSIGAVRVSFKRAGYLGEVRVGPRRSGRYKGYAAHLVEFGTRSRVTRGAGKYRRGSNRGIMPRRPFIRPAFRQEAKTVEGLIKQSVQRVLVRTMKKYIR